MEGILVSSLIFLLGLSAVLFVTSKNWHGSFISFLFANRTLHIGFAGLAISSHWFWAIAIFVGPAVAYNWGLIGLLWFVIPNAWSVLIVGWLATRVRDKYPDGFSLTGYVKENFSKRVSALYQIDFVVIAFAALLLAFTAIGKLWAFTNLAGAIDPIYASLIVGLITLAFTTQGGIRTSIFTGSIQSVLWFVFLAITTVAFLNTDMTFVSQGKNELSNFFTEKFITTFAVAWVLSVSVGATSHGMMWQKAFSMPKESIMPTFTLGAVVFGVITFLMSMLGMIAFANGLEVKAPDTSNMVSIMALLGVGGIIAFATLVIGQTSTVIDASLNYVASLVSMEWLRKEDVVTSRVIMVCFLLLAWLASWLKFEIWTIVMLMGCIRIVMFVPIALHILNVKLRESAIFYSSIAAVTTALYLSYTARVDKLPIYDMYSALAAILIPSITLLVLSKKDN
jgi:Na+/proline symporter